MNGRSVVALSNALSTYSCFQKLLKSEGFKDEAVFDADYKKTEKDLSRHRKKDAVDGDDQEEEEPSFPLIDTPDEQVRSLTRISRSSIAQSYNDAYVVG